MYKNAVIQINGPHDLPVESERQGLGRTDGIGPELITDELDGVIIGEVDGPDAGG